MGNINPLDYGVCKSLEMCKKESRIFQRESWQDQMDLIRSMESEETWICEYSDLMGNKGSFNRPINNKNLLR